METVERRVRLDAETCKVVIELLNPSPMSKMHLEIILAEQANALRTNLIQSDLWLNFLKMILKCYQ